MLQECACLTPRENPILAALALRMPEKRCSLENLIRVAERFFSGVPQPPPPWRLLPESFYFDEAIRGADLEQVPSNAYPAFKLLRKG